jgi:hypothetical protein
MESNPNQEYKMADLEFDAGLFLAAYTCVSTEETRYYLQGVFVTPAVDPATGRGVLMVATDGHRMALVYDANGRADHGRIIRLDPKSKALKLARGESARVLHIDGLAKGAHATARVMSGYTGGKHAPVDLDVIRLDEIDGAFPDWTRVLPQGPVEGIAVHAGQTFNPDYLAGFGKAFKALTGNRVGSFSIAQPSAGSPAWIWDNNLPHVRFICMPMRVGSDDPGRPYWLSLPR